MESALRKCVDIAYPLAELSTGLTNGDHGGIRYAATGVRYLRGQSVTEFGLDLFKDVLFIDPSEHERMIRAEVVPGDVLYTIAGSTGNACVVRGIDRANINQAIVRIRPSNKIDSQYLADFLNSSFGRLQSERKANGGVQLNINFSEVKSLQVLVPPLKAQRGLVAELDAARAERDGRLEKANALLGSLDHYVLSRLGIDPGGEQRRIFAVRFSDVRPRLDADYHSPRFQRLRRAIESSTYPTRRLDELTVFIRSGFAAGRQDQTHGDDSGIPHLRPLNLNAWGELSIAETKRVPASAVSASDFIVRGEVLFNNTNSPEWVGKSAVFDLEEACACSNHMTRVRLKDGSDPYFLTALLNAFRGIGYFSVLSTFFNNQAGINTATLGELRIPVPDVAIQQSIATSIRDRKEKASQLRALANTIWRQARERFEQQLLKGDAL
jgi:type I restriction enzyme S subunit